MRLSFEVASLSILAALSIGCAGSGEAGRAEGGTGGEGASDSVVVTSRYDLDAAAVPSALRHLVPLAERWGIGDDVERNDYVVQASAADRAALRDAVVPYYEQITAWLDSFGDEPMSDEAAAFMYMQLAIEEAPE